MFAVKKLSATQTTKERGQSLQNLNTKRMYFAEYESLAGNIICSDRKTQNKLTESLQEQAIRNVAKNLFSEIRY